MKKPKKTKYPKKPKLKKLPAKPKLPKGGINTRAQLDAWKKKKSDYLKKVNLINSENKKRESNYKSVCTKIDSSYKKQLQIYNNFKAEVARAIKF